MNYNLLFIWIAFALALITPWVSGKRFLAQIFVNRCVTENWHIFQTDYPTCEHPYVIISFCHVGGKEHFYTSYNETAIVKPLPHFSSFSFLINFVYVTRQDHAQIFQTFYERLVIAQPHHKLFQFKAVKYRKYPQYDAGVFKMEFLRSRWNYDEMTLYMSNMAYDLIVYNENQQPLSLERHNEKFKSRNLSDLLLTYHVNSGYKQECNHANMYDKLASLTLNFNAYDRIFCDTFEKYGLQRSFLGYWNPDDMFWLRGRLLRDETLTLFPPDASNAVYYASPKLTFVVLQHQQPITWLFVFRPFSKFLWIFLILTFGIMELIRPLKSFLDYLHDEKLKRSLIKRKIFAVILYEDLVKAGEINARYKNIIDVLSNTMRILVMSTYSGMILVGILNPLYPWTPGTFEELNHTRNYYVCTAKQSPDLIMEHLTESGVLSGISKDMKVNRKQEHPTDFLSMAIDPKGAKQNQGKFYAVIMYDDKMNLWIKGRDFLWKSAPLLKRIKPVSDKVLPEMRYISVAPGATRLHFLVETIRWVVTAGTWMRWYYLEQNYYANVAPLVVPKRLKEMGIETTEVKQSRPLTLLDLFSVFVIKGLGLIFAFIFYLCEMRTST